MSRRREGVGEESKLEFKNGDIVLLDDHSYSHEWTKFSHPHGVPSLSEMQERRRRAAKPPGYPKPEKPSRPWGLRFSVDKNGSFRFNPSNSAHYGEEGNSPGGYRPGANASDYVQRIHPTRLEL